MSKSSHSSSSHGGLSSGDGSSSGKGSGFGVHPDALDAAGKKLDQHSSDLSDIGGRIKGVNVGPQSFGVIGQAFAGGAKSHVDQTAQAVNHAATSVGHASTGVRTSADVYREVDDRNHRELDKIDRALGAGGSLPSGTHGAGATNAGTSNSGGRSRGASPSDSPRDHAIPGEQRCTGGTEPVDLATGHVVMSETDLEILAPLGLIVERMHISSYRAGQWFGPTWTSTLDQRLQVDKEHVRYFSPDGMILVYPLPSDGSPVLPIEGPRWPLTAREGGGYRIEQSPRARTLHFGPLADRDRVLPLLAVEDGDGRRIDIDHHRFGPPKAMRHSDGYRVKIDSRQERITAIRVLDPRRDLDVLVMRYGYDERSRLTEVINSSGIPLRFDYDDADRMTGWQDRNGHWFRYTYDEHGRCVRTTGDHGYFDATIVYNGPVTTHTDSLGGAWRYHFNESKQLVREVDPLGNATESTWDRYDRLLSRTDPLGRTTHYEYDSDGRPSLITRPDGSMVRLTLKGDTVGSITVDDGERVWIRLYDKDDQPDPFGGKVGVAPEFRLDSLEAGRRKPVPDDPGATGRPGQTVDLFGRQTETTTATGGRVQLGWTVEGRAAWRVDPLGNRTHWQYDPEGNEIAHTDEMGGVTANEYGPFEVVLASVDPTGARTTREYDTERNPTSITNPQGQTWRYVHDLAGRVAEETDFDGRTLRYVYDAAGQLVRSINGAGEVTDYVYDLLGNLVEWRAPSGNTSYTYAPNGKLIRAANADAVLEFEWDDQDRITAETVNGRSVTFEYDDENDTFRRRTPSGVDSLWSYDHAGSPTRLSVGGHSLSFAHDAAGREIQRSVDETATLVQSYDSDRLASQAVTGRSGQDVVRRVFRYRADGHLVGTEDGISGEARFQLDPGGRVVEVIAPDRRENYRYDGVGNIVSASGLGTDEPGPRRYTGNTLVAAGAVSYQYDAQGRLVRKAGSPDRNWRYTWDSYDRLTSVTTPEGAVWRYRYDPVGRRIAKQRLVPGPGTGPVVAEQVEFTWDGGTLIEQVHTDAQGRYEVTTWEHHPDNDAPVAQLEHGRDSRERFHSIVTDAVGKPTDLIDAHGTIAWRDSTSLWGRRLPDPRATAGTPLRFPGQYADTETGLHYNVYRYYDPTTGRYISQDPLGLAPAPNPAAYAGNPHSETDPLGLATGRKHAASTGPTPGKGAHNAANVRKRAGKFRKNAIVNHDFKDASVRARKALDKRQGGKLTDSQKRAVVNRKRKASEKMGEAGALDYLKKRTGNSDLSLVTPSGKKPLDLSLYGTDTKKPWPNAVALNGSGVADVTHYDGKKVHVVEAKGGSAQLSNGPFGGRKDGKLGQGDNDYLKDVANQMEKSGHADGRSAVGAAINKTIGTNNLEYTTVSTRFDKATGNAIVRREK